MSIVAFPAREDAELANVLLDGVGVDVALANGLVGFDEETTIDGSPTMRVSVHDRDHTLVSSGLLELRDGDDDRLAREVELAVDGAAYWLRQVAKREDVLELTFEDRTVARLRGRYGPLKVSAAAADDRRFATRLCAAADVPTPIVAEAGPRELAARTDAGLATRLREDRAQRERDRDRAPGVADGAPVTVKDAPASAEQLRNINTALTEAVRHQPTELALVTLVAAIVVESAFLNRRGSGADSTSFGLLQNIPGTSAGVDGRMTRAQALDIAYSVRSALLPPGPTSAGGLIKVSKQQPNLDPGTLADICINGVGVGDPGYAGKVNARRREAKRIVAAFGAGTTGGGATAGGVREAPLTVGRDESYWDALRRTADERNARFFVVANQPYYLYDEALMLSRPQMTLSEQSPGVDWIDWEWAPHKPLRRVELQCRARDWQAPLGSVVLLDASCGPAGATREDPNRGRWLVSEYERSRFEPTARITLVKGRRPRVPTGELQTLGGDAGGAVAVGRGGTTSPFGGVRRFPITGAYGTDRGSHVHSGLDVGVPCGTPCIAPFDGRVTHVSTSGFGDAGGMIHLHALADVPGTPIRAGDKVGWGHISAARASVGQTVAAGTPIATSGGKPCHVHFVWIRPGHGGNGIDGNSDPTALLRALGGLL